MELLPPRNKFQTWVANDSAWESEEKPTWPVAPPRLRVTSLPLDWQVLISLAMADWQLARSVPENVGSSHWLQVCKNMCEKNLRHLMCDIRTFEKSITGSPPVPLKMYRKASGIMSIESS